MTLSARPLHTWPPTGTDLILVTSGATGAVGAWVEITAATEAVSRIVGFVVTTAGPSDISGPLVIELGTGAVAAEVSLGEYFIRHNGARLDAVSVLMVPVMIGPLAIGTRLAARTRVGNAAPVLLGVIYEDGTSPNTGILAPYTYAPKGTPDNQGRLITPNVTPWGSSAWFELIVLDAPAILLGVAPWWFGSSDNWGLRWEVDLGIGAAASETVITTLTGVFPNTGALGMANTWLPAVYPVPAGTRVSARLRKEGINGDVVPVHLIYIGPYARGGSITVLKITSPPTDPASFDFTAGGGLTPETFSLTHGTSQFFEAEAGSGYTVEEVANALYATTYDVSNDSPIDDLTVASDENVIVTVTNTLTQPVIVVEGENQWRLLRFDVKNRKEERA